MTLVTRFPRLASGLTAALGATLLLGCSGSQGSPEAAQAAQPRAAADPLADDAQNVRLVAHHDMQGRQALQLTARSDAQNGNWLYVGYQPNARTDPDTPQMNSITVVVVFKFK